VLTGAELDIWQADSSGNYDFSNQFRLRGKVKTDQNGQYQFETILPAQRGSRRARIHFKIRHPEAGPLTTQLFFSEVYDPDKVGGSGTVINISEVNGVLRGEFNITMPAQQFPGLSPEERDTGLSRTQVF
jgi:protocatechuate 3,4-dioxygenase beta subunit